MTGAFRLSRSALLVCSFSMPLMAFADTSTDTANALQLDTIVVSDTPFSQQTGTQKITEQQIRLKPSKDGNITELLRNNPNVQFSNSADTSESGGEIAPNEVSIHGAAFYSNNYTIDNLSNNDNLNPASDNSLKAGKDVDGYSPMDLPGGGTQAFWIDSSLLKNVEVFDSNVSAKHGNFTGGVINAELKDPDLRKFSGKVFYRITRDDWASFKVDDEEKFSRAETLGSQPQFTKQQYGIVLNQPIGDKGGLLFQYTRSESKIPYHNKNLGTWVNQRRTNETFLLRGVYLPDNGDLLKATLMYSPHESRYYKADIKNGQFTNTGGGVQVNLQWDHDFNWGKMKTTLGYKKSGNKIEHESDVYNYYVTGIDWCSSYNSRTGACIYGAEGGYGTYQTEKQTWTIKQDFDVTAFDTGPLQHKLGFGWEVDLAKAKYQRENDAYTNTYALINARRPALGQYLKTYTLYPKRDVSVGDNTYAAYLEDSITWKRLNVTLGARVDYDEYLGNTNIAPRFSASYDLFGDGTTRLFGGINRYYAGTVLSYKLRNSIGQNTLYSRTSSTGTFTEKARNTSYDVSDLKTPYSDEYNLGVEQQLFGTKWTFKWVNRKERNQFTRTSQRINNLLTYNMTNAGKSNNDTYSLTISPLQPYKMKFAEVGFNLGAQISKTKSNYNSYDVAALDDGIDMMILNGKLQSISNGLPATDYNTPWSTFLELNTHFPQLNLDWSQRFSYNSGYRYYATDTGNCPAISDACGSYAGKVKVYDEKTQGSYFNLDWRFLYKQPIYQGQYLEFSLDINNVLNRKVLATTSGSTSTYKMGRNFWLGVSYNW